MREAPIVKDLRSKTKAKDLTSKAKAKAKDFIKCPRGHGHGLEDFITAYCTTKSVQNWSCHANCAAASCI